MTRRTLSPEERAVRQDVHLYREHLRIIELVIKKHQFEGWNSSDVIRCALQEYGARFLGVELGLDKAVEAEKHLEVFKSEHDGMTPSDVMAEKRAEADRLEAVEVAQNQEVDEVKVALERKVYRFLKKKDPKDSRTVSWFKNAWYSDLSDQGWTGSPLEMMYGLLAKGDKEGWDNGGEP